MGTSTTIERGTENPISAPEGERKGLERLSALLKERGAKRVRVRLANGDELELPQSAIAVLRAAADALAHGDAMSLVRIERELTSQQTAELLNVSRQYVTRLADGGELPAATTEGGHRRFRLVDVLSYRQRRDAGRRRALGELMDITEEYGGYPELKGR